jgi:hypothetical protein
MRHRGIALAIGVALISLAVVPGGSFAQDSEEHDMGGMQVPKPGPEHAELAKAAGKWKAVQKMRMDPSQPPAEFTGVEEVRMVCGGMWLESVYTSTAAGMPFEGRGFETYDPNSRMYKGTWVDSWSTTPATFEGTVVGKVQTCIMKTVDPMGNPSTMCMQTTWTDDNTRVFRMYMGPKPEGDWMMEITYTRM